jgi:cohesin complex subunit SA-1/2
MMEYRPANEQKDLLIDFIKTYVFSSRYDEVQDETRIEELHKKRSHLAAYCKLVVYNILPTTAACDIFKYYIKVRLFRGGVRRGFKFFLRVAMIY